MFPYLCLVQTKQRQYQNNNVLRELDYHFRYYGVRVMMNTTNNCSVCG